MTSVDFYSNVDDKLLFACQITAKARATGRPVLIYAEPRDAAAVDARLWATPLLAFIPHCYPQHRLAAETPVIIAHEPHDFHHHDVLINLRAEWPPFFSRFERLVEIVSRDDADKAAARERWKFYKDRGYPLQNHDMARKP